MEWKYESFSDIFHGTTVDYKAIFVTNKQNIERPKTAYIGSKTISIDFIGLSLRSKAGIDPSCRRKEGVLQQKDIQGNSQQKSETKDFYGPPLRRVFFAPLKGGGYRKKGTAMGALFQL